MKKIVILLLALLLFACNEKKTGIEVTTDGYYSNFEIRKTAGFAQDDAALKQKDELFAKVREMGKELKSDDDSYTYKLFVDSNGKLNKIFVLTEQKNKVNEYIIETLKKMKYVAGEKDGKKVNSTFKVYLSTSDYLVAAEEMPQPVGGIVAIQEKLRYPEIAKRAGIQGRVFVKAFISEKGVVDSTELIKGIGGGCDEAAMEAIKNTKFIPGVMSGKPVKTVVSIPLLFKLK